MGEANNKRLHLRPDMRPEVHDDINDSRARAEARSKELLGHMDGNMDEGSDKYYIDRSAIPDGWDYEWKRRTVWNEEDPSYQTNLAQKGWEPVPVSRHPEMMPMGWKESMIQRDGMVLMERPKQITEMSRENERRKAAAQVRIKEQQLTQAPSGQFDRNNQNSPLAKIGKSYEPLPIPD